MERQIDFTRGRIIPPLLRFVVPVFLALFLQSMYGAVDLMIVGKFAYATDVSAVATGSQITMTLTNLISSLAMGMTILIGEKIGMGQPEEGGRIVGSGILLFSAIGLFMTAATATLAPQLAAVMQAPKEAFELTTSYIRICGMGMIVIISYNLIGSICRGLGDSRTPLVTVMIACICNIVGDLLLVAVFRMGTRGAAIATVFAQFVSVVISLLMIRRKPLPFTLDKDAFSWNGKIVSRILKVGTPIALQDLLVGISFLVLLAIVNSLGLICSAGVGVAEKVCAFIMLVPAAFMQSMSAFVAQNRGAGKTDRAVRGLWYAVAISSTFGVLMFYVTFFHGDMLASIFANDAEVVSAAAQYLKAYGIDCLLTCFLFCFIGFFNGMERTRFVMIQGIAGAFLVRIPVAFLMSRQVPVSLFHVGLATPCSTVLQIIMCFIYFAALHRRKALVD
ncbi:MAG TPA: MATE family efflux transporter [Sphaerochaeta sp.]|nr:MATE family efflux transporter [Sphaerochaeta sp.]